MNTVLVVDDEPAVRRFLRTALTSKGFEVTEASTGVEAVERIRGDRPQLVILDLGLPDMPGIEVTRMVREWSRVPIIILSVRDREAEKVQALDAGADDYLTKPFGLAELMARMRVALRHAQPSQQEPVFRSGPLSIDFSAREVSVDGRPVTLTPTEYELLMALVKQAGKVLTHSMLLRQVWGIDGPWDLHLLRVNISNLRRKIERNPGRPVLLVTEAGVGYRMRLVEPD